MSNIRICVYAICKNELKFIDKWLDNMSEADDIVVLDTGSTDGTYEKLKDDLRVTRVEQKIISPFRFDVARNESMKLVPDEDEILVCTDFDELFEKGWAQALKDKWISGDTNRVFYTYHWSHNVVGEPQDTMRYDKIHTKGYHWKYPVHEVLWMNDGVLQKAINLMDSIVLHHYQDKNKPRKFYFDLLKLACEENPEDSHIQMLYAREFILQGNLEKGLEEILKCLKMPDIDNPLKRLVLLWCLQHAAESYADLKNYDEAIWYAQEFIKEDYTYREPYLLLAWVYCQMKMFTLAEAMCECAFKYGTQHRNWVEEGYNFLGRPYELLAVSQFNLNKIDKASKNFKEALKHDPNNVELLKNYIACLEKTINKENK